MKKIVLTGLILFSFIITTQAQDVNFGFKGGINLANIVGDDVMSNIDARTGYHIGGVLQVGVTPLFAIQPELIYSAQGYKDFEVDYLNLPVLFKLKFAKVLSVEAGPQFGFLVNDSLKEGILEKPESFDLSGAVGAGVQLGNFFAQLRYNIGFTEVTKDLDQKNSVFQASVGFFIF